MMQKIIKFKIQSIFSVFVFLFFPILASAQTKTLQLQCFSAAQGCGWSDFMILVNTVVGFLLYLAITAAVLLFVYAGFLYLTAAGSETQVKKAHSVMFKAVVGLIVALLAWLIVQFILTGLGVNPGYSLLGS